jgi:hypothetical protein
VYTLRRWSVRHAGLLESAYRVLDRLLDLVRPLVRRIGYEDFKRKLS